MFKIRQIILSIFFHFQKIRNLTPILYYWSRKAGITKLNNTIIILYKVNDLFYKLLTILMLKLYYILVSLKCEKVFQG